MDYRAMANQFDDHGGPEATLDHGCSRSIIRF